MSNYPEEFMSEVQRSLGRLEGKQDTILEQLQSQAKKVDDHETQISRINRKLAYYAGGVGVLSFLAAKALDFTKLIG